MERIVTHPTPQVQVKAVTANPVELKVIKLPPAVPKVTHRRRGQKAVRFFK
jgi:hypothetical protein